MRRDAKVSVIIPAVDEEKSIGKVLSAIPDWVDDVIVVDNGSRDRTGEVALAHGAQVISEPVRGYGTACLTGISSLDKPDIVVFLDGDFSDHPDEMRYLVDPILEGRASLVIGSRSLGEREPGALAPQARFGNWLACWMIRMIWKVRFTDLGPFRAISYKTLKSLGMRDPNYGWTVEMQIRAVIRRIPVLEVPVQYRKRLGKSKVSGTVRGVLGAGYKIISTIITAGFFRKMEI